MTERSNRQRKAPRFVRDVYLVAAAAGPAPADALASVAEAVELPPERLVRYLHSGCYAADDPAALHDALGMAPQGYLPLPAGAGLLALWEAAKGVASGYSDAILVADDAACAVVADRETAQTLRRDPLQLHVAAGTDRDTAVAYVQEMLGALAETEHALTEGSDLAAVAASEETIRGGEALLEGIASAGGGPATLAVLSRPASR